MPEYLFGEMVIVFDGEGSINSGRLTQLYVYIYIIIYIYIYIYNYIYIYIYIVHLHV